MNGTFRLHFVEFKGIAARIISIELPIKQNPIHSDTL